ncbi:MAG: hypothetical protein GAK38_04186 [Xylophilus sp.]|nr:MAG: hypothetical protein GAK38_04186 [Xylophilus sp.]
MKYADGIGLSVVRAERIRADQLCKLVRLMRVCAANGAHFMQNHRNASLRNLPRGFGACETAAYDMYGGEIGIF